MKRIEPTSAGKICEKIYDILENYCQEDYDYVVIACTTKEVQRFAAFFEGFDWGYIGYDSYDYWGDYYISVSADRTISIEKAFFDDGTVKECGDAVITFISGDCSSRILNGTSGLRVEFDLL